MSQADDSQIQPCRKYVREALEQHRQEMEKEIRDWVNAGISRMEQRIRESGAGDRSVHPTRQGEALMEASNAKVQANAERGDDAPPSAHTLTTNLDYAIATTQSAAALWPSAELSRGPAQFALFLPALVAAIDKSPRGPDQVRPDAAERVAIPALFGGVAWALLRVLKR